MPECLEFTNSASGMTSFLTQIHEKNPDGNARLPDHLNKQLFGTDVGKQ